MADIYVYDKDCTDFTSFGLVGALTPISCVFEEEANGMSEITLEHPVDAMGRHTQLICNNLLMVEVPVRTTPEIEDNKIVTQVEKWKVKSSKETSNVQRTLYKKKSSDTDGDARIKIIPSGTEVTVVRIPTDGTRYKVKTKYGSGYMEPDGLELELKDVSLEDKSQSIESVEPAWTVKPQVFRIYSVSREINSVTVSARHISYDLLYNLTNYKKTTDTKCSEALWGILNHCVSPHDFEGFTNLANTRTGNIDWMRKNPIEALLDPDTGLTTLYDASLVRDNWELYVLDDPGMNRGVTIEYGKNMTGITYTESYDEVVTRIIPVGETEDGEVLLLTDKTEDAGNYVDTTRKVTVDGEEKLLINVYPVIYAQVLECEDCTVSSDSENYLTKEDVRERMREQAKAIFDADGDLPTVEVSVDFVNLGDTAEYAQYKDLEKLFLWDYVSIHHNQHGIDLTARIVSIKWDCLLGRMESMEIGSVGATLSNSGITTWQIPTGIQGSKIASGSISGVALRGNIISTRHVQANSINADAIQANAVTAGKIAAGEIKTRHIEAGAVKADQIDAKAVTAEKIDAGAIKTEHIQANAITANQIASGAVTAAKIKAGAISAEKIASKTITAEQIAAKAITAEKLAAGAVDAGAISAMTAKIGSLTAKDIQTDSLAAALAAFTVITAGTAQFDRATVQHLVAQAMNLSFGTADEVFIENLRVGYAQMVSATVGNLCIKASDGKYYTLDVDQNGNVTAAAVTVSAGEITAGQTTAGKVILETNITAESLNTANLLATYALVNRIDAARF